MNEQTPDTALHPEHYLPCDSTRGVTPAVDGVCPYKYCTGDQTLCVWSKNFWSHHDAEDKAEMNRSWEAFLCYKPHTEGAFDAPCDGATKECPWSCPRKAATKLA